MPEYTSMVKGTIKAIGRKAKELADDAALRDMYDRSTTTARCYANIAKMNVLINGELEDEQKLFAEIGRLCYELYKSAPPEEFAELFDRVTQTDEKIETLREELSAAKAAVRAARAGK